MGSEDSSHHHRSPMNCREFRNKHDAYVDDTLNEVDLDAMALHRQLCEGCSQLDTRVRRALLVARNLPMIQPSAAFGQRLQARLDAERNSELGPIQDDTFASHGSSMFGGRYAIVMTAVLMAAGVAGTLALATSRDDVIRMTPVVASLPETELSPLTTPTMVASVSAGMPMWPAVFVAQQAPWHFASDAAGR